MINSKPLESEASVSVLLLYCEKPLCNEKQRERKKWMKNKLPANEIKKVTT